jgi:hypothetical protein
MWLMGAAALCAGGAMLALAPAAQARVVVGLGIGVPGPVYYAPPPPVYYAPPPVVYAPPPAPAYLTPPPPAAAPTAAAGPVGECREYQTQTMIDGQPQVSRGTACLQPDGTWRLMN